MHNISPLKDYKDRKQTSPLIKATLPHNHMVKHIHTRELHRHHILQLTIEQLHQSIRVLRALPK